MDFPRNGRHAGASRRGPLEGLVIDALEMTVTSGAIVEDFDVVEDVSARQIPRPVNALLDPLLLETVRSPASSFPDVLGAIGVRHSSSSSLQSGLTESCSCLASSVASRRSILSTSTIRASEKIAYSIAVATSGAIARHLGQREPPAL